MIELTLHADGDISHFGGMFIDRVIASQQVKCPREQAGNWCWQYWQDLGLSHGRVSCEEGELVKNMEDSRPTWKPRAAH